MGRAADGLPSIASATAVACKLCVASLFWYSALFDIAPQWPSVVDYVAARGLPAPYLLGAGALVFELVAPVLLLLPRFERWSAAALAAYCVATALLFHGFWDELGSNRTAQAFHFFKNIAIAGALTQAFVLGRSSVQ